MTSTPGERPVGPAAVEGRPRSNKSTMATTLVSSQLNMTRKLLAGFEQRRVDSAVASRATPTNSGAVAGQAPSPQAARRPLALGESGRRGNLDRPRFRQSGPVPPGSPILVALTVDVDDTAVLGEKRQTKYATTHRPRHVAPAGPDRWSAGYVTKSF